VGRPVAGVVTSLLPRTNTSLAANASQTVDDTRSEQVFNLCQLSLGVALYRAGSARHRRFCGAVAALADGGCRSEPHSYPRVFARVEYFHGNRRSPRDRCDRPAAFTKANANVAADG